MLSNLNPDLLYVIVFGPGVGESIVLRIPPSHWVVVDGLAFDGFSPAAVLLDAMKVAWAGIVLTHDHEDHAPGLGSVLRANGGGPVGCSKPFIDRSRSRRNSANGAGQYKEGTTEDTLAKIDDRWNKDTAAQWDMAPGDKRTIGDAEFVPLWPDLGQLPDFAEGMENRFSTPLLVSWRQLRLLLGADLPSREWGLAGKIFSGLGDHSSFKVAHHCSKWSVSDVYAPAYRPESPTWIATPFSKSRLPRLADGEGVDQLLQRVSEIHLTALPHPPNASLASPHHAKRTDLSNVTPKTSSLPGGIVLEERLVYRREQALTHYFIAAGFDEHGKRADIRYGSGTFVVCR